MSLSIAYSVIVLLQYLLIMAIGDAASSLFLTQGVSYRLSVMLRDC
jgi:hypothetical protein